MAESNPKTRMHFVRCEWLVVLEEEVEAGEGAHSSWEG